MNILMCKDKLMSLILLLLLLSPVTFIVEANADNSPQYKWTFMVYLDADNNLESAGISDVNEMEVAGSTDEVAIIVLMDRHPGYDITNGNWTTAKILKVVHDIDMENVASEELIDLGEVNMGDPETLVTFVSYVAKNFPAEHYALVLWDHGDAWRRLELAGKGVCWDETNDMDYLTEVELVQALSQIANMGISIDIIGFDVCLLQMVEVEFDMMNFADIMVASEEFEPLDGWAYHKFLPQLIANPSMTAELLAFAIVQGYAEYYTQDNPIDWVTLSAINLAKLSSAIGYLDSMALMLTLNVYFYPENATTIINLRNKAEKFCQGEFIDVKHFAILVNQTGGWPYPADLYADLFIKAFENATIAYFAGQAHPNAYGAAIYFPPNVDWYLEERFWYYEQTAFSSYTWWGAFLDYFFRTMTPVKEYSVEVTAPSIVTPGSVLSSIILTQFGNERIDPDWVSAYVIFPDGTSIPIPVNKLDIGLYITTYQLSNNLSSTLISILVEAKYWFLKKSSITTIYVSKEISEILSKAMNIEGGINMVNSSVEEIKYNLASLHKDLSTNFSKLSDQLQVVQTNLNDLVKKVGESILSELHNAQSELSNLINNVGNSITREVSSVKSLVESGTSAINAALNALNSSVNESLIKLNNLQNFQYVVVILLVITLVISAVAVVTKRK